MIGNLLNRETYKNWTLFIEPQINFFSRVNNKKFDFATMIVTKVIKEECLLITKI